MIHQEKAESPFKYLEWTQLFLQQFQQRLRYLVWLNPVPKDRWNHTTAGVVNN